MCTLRLVRATSATPIDHRGESIANLELDRDGLERLRRFAHITTDGQLAERIGVDPATVSRILSGKCAPGTIFIAGLLSEFGTDRFDDVFVVTDDRVIVPGNGG